MPDLFGDEILAKPSFTEMLVEAQREVGFRRRNYPMWVSRGTMKEPAAKLHLHRMEAIAKFLEWAIPREAEIRAIAEKEKG